MNATQLLAHFDRLAEAPDAVPRLRRFILDLAVRGKLVEQDARDEPAAELLKKIRAYGPKSLASKKSSPPTNVPDSEVDQPFAIPESWMWTRLCDLGRTQTGATPSKNAGEVYGNHIPFVKPGDLLPSHVDYSGEGLSELGLKDSGRFTPAGSLLMVCIGTIGKCQLVDRTCSFNQQINSIAPYDGLESRYLLGVFMSEFFQNAAWTASAKTTIAILNKGKWEQLSVPLPPLAEQHRIVAKVDELMALCDQLEAAQQERERRRDRLAAASLQRLNQPADVTNPETQREHARFHLHHLPCLTTRPEHIKAIRQTIRNLAICGRLIPQDASDESAAVFLSKVEEDRARLVQAGEIGVAKRLQPVDFDAIPFTLPFGWEWTRFGVLINHSDAGISPKTEGFPRSGDHWGVLKVSAVSWDWFKPEENKQLFQGLVPPDYAHVQAGDFLISRANTSALVAKCVIVDEKPVKLILSDKTVRLRITSLGNQRFWCLVNNHAAYAREYYASQASGTSDSMKNVSRPIIYNLLMPIPPLAEQHRIVAKVDQLMALCDQLEAQLTTTQTDSRRLLEAVLHEALAPV